MNKVSSRIFIGVLASFMLCPLIVHGDNPLEDALFHIERNKNANIVQYEARLTTSGLLATLDMALNLGRTILIRRDGQDYRAIADINGETSYVDKVFIHARGKGLTTRVNYIEWYGHSVHSGEELYERFSP
jgi:hypothetical protein